jgi:putative endonuclease
MASKTGTLYTGVTSDLYLRVQQHKNHTFEGFTAKYECTRLVWFQEFADVRNAIRREKQIKGWTRAKKIALIESENERWQDMAEDWGARMLMRNERIDEQKHARSSSRIEFPSATPDGET